MITEEEDDFVPLNTDRAVPEKAALPQEKPLATLIEEIRTRKCPVEAVLRLEARMKDMEAKIDRLCSYFERSASLKQEPARASPLATAHTDTNDDPLDGKQSGLTVDNDGNPQVTQKYAMTGFQSQLYSWWYGRKNQKNLGRMSEEERAEALNSFCTAFYRA